MGYYIQGPQTGKWRYLEQQFSAEPCTPDEARSVLGSLGFVPVCVVSNGPFEAAAVAFDSGEFDCFNRPDDMRPKQWYIMDRAEAFRLSGFKG